MSSSKGTRLITSYETNLTVPGCRPGADTRVLHLCLPNDISEVLPYLNAELEGASYEHRARVLVWKGEDRKYAFRPHEITIAPIREQAQVDLFCREAVELVNDVWQRRGAIEPDYSKVEQPLLMEIFTQLPRTNCRECGFATCMAFAAAFRDNPLVREKCPYF